MRGDGLVPTTGLFDGAGTPGSHLELQAPEQPRRSHSAAKVCPGLEPPSPSAVGAGGTWNFLGPLRVGLPGTLSINRILPGSGRMSPALTGGCWVLGNKPLCTLSAALQESAGSPQATEQLAVSPPALRITAMHPALITGWAPALSSAEMPGSLTAHSDPVPGGGCAQTVPGGRQRPWSAGLRRALGRETLGSPFLAQNSLCIGNQSPLQPTAGDAVLCCWHELPPEVLALVLFKYPGAFGQCRVRAPGV